jgi:hypothetical protein
MKWLRRRRSQVRTQFTRLLSIHNVIGTWHVCILGHSIQLGRQQPHRQHQQWVPFVMLVQRTVQMAVLSNQNWSSPPPRLAKAIDTLQIVYAAQMALEVRRQPCTLIFSFCLQWLFRMLVDIRHNA